MAEVYPNAGIIAARIVGESSEMDRIADALLIRARANAGNDHTFASSLRTRRVRGRSGVMDRVVEATDPLAAPKELGHVIRNETDGPVLGYVKGRHALGNAARDMPAVGRD